MEILYSDNHLFALNKPADLLTQPSGTDRDSLETRAKAWIKVNEEKPGEVYLHAVHRLDAPVSGIVLFARTSKALTRLNSAIRSRTTHKTYLALVSPPPKLQKHDLEDFLLHDEYSSKVVSERTLGAQKALLHYRVIATADAVALLEVRPETGRYHQIRVQLSTHGSPILGDRRYRGKDWQQKGIALHHCELEIVHPVKQTPLVIKAPPPSYWPERLLRGSGRSRR